jgi:hypothetical protein
MNNNYSRIRTGDLLAEVNKAIADITAKGLKIHVTLEILDMLAAVGAMQLALRHPGMPKTSRIMVGRLIGQLRYELREYPALVELIHRGGNADYDVTDQEMQAFRLVLPGGPGDGQDGD